MHTFIPITDVQPGMVVIPSFGARPRRVVAVSRTINENGVDIVRLNLSHFGIRCGYVAMGADRQVAKVFTRSAMRKAMKASAA